MPPLELALSASPGERPHGRAQGEEHSRNERLLGTGQPYDGPFPAPIGVLTLGEFFELVNWRNQPDELQALPLLGVVAPPAGSEWTVGAVMSQFAWD